MHTPTTGNLLITSISKKVPLLKSVREAWSKLRMKGKLFGGDMDAKCIGQYFVDTFWHMPPLDDLIIEQFLGYCNQHQIRWIIPTRDAELAFFAEHKNLFEQQGIYVMVSFPEAVMLCLDKLQFYQFSLEKPFPIIPTFDHIDSLSASRFVVKEQHGAGSYNMGINLTYDEAKVFACGLNNPIFQAYIEGTEYSVDVYVDLSGKAKGAIARERNLVVCGESHVTTTVRNEELEQVCSEMVECLGLYGHAVLQVLVDHTGGFHIIECNCRFGGASSLSLATGLNSFYWFFLESTQQNLADYPFQRSQQEKRLIRYAEDLIECL